MCHQRMIDVQLATQFAAVSLFFQIIVITILQAIERGTLLVRNEKVRDREELEHGFNGGSDGKIHLVFGIYRNCLIFSMVNYLLKILIGKYL